MADEEKKEVKDTKVDGDNFGNENTDNKRAENPETAPEHTENKQGDSQKQEGASPQSKEKNISKRKKKKENEFPWAIVLWGIELAFYLFGCGVFFLSLSANNYRPDTWYYFLLWTILTICASVNAMFSKHSFMYFSNILLLMIYTFVIPFALYAYGKPLAFAVTALLFFVIITVAVTPRLVGGGIVIGSILFSCFLIFDKDEFKKSVIIKESELPAIKKNMSGGQLYSTPYANYKTIKVKQAGRLPEISALPEVYGNPAYWKYLYDANFDRIKKSDEIIPAGMVLLVPYKQKEISQDFLKIAIIFISASILAFCWKLLVVKMYETLTVNKPVTTSDPKIKQKLSEAERQLIEKEKIIRVFKEEIALAILEMRKIIRKKI